MTDAVLFLCSFRENLSDVMSSASRCDTPSSCYQFAMEPPGVRHSRNFVSRRLCHLRHGSFKMTRICDATSRHQVCRHHKKTAISSLIGADDVFQKSIYIYTAFGVFLVERMCVCVLHVISERPVQRALVPRASFF